MHTHMSVTNVQIRRAPRVLPIDGRDMGGGVAPWIETGSMIRVTRDREILIACTSVLLAYI